jgi:hypothetical protein
LKVRRELKKKSTSPALYHWSQTKDAADKLETWAYNSLIKPESPHAKTYPLCGASSLYLADESYGFILSPEKTTRRTKQIPQAVKVWRQLDELAAELRQAKISERYYSPGMVAEDLSCVIIKVNELLAELTVDGGGKVAARQFFHAVLHGANELEKLSFNKDIFPTLQAIAQKETMWPVIYSPKRSRQRELEARMKRLGVGKYAVAKVVGASWSNKFNHDGKPGAGVFANRMGWMLWQVHFDGNLRRCLSRLAGEPLPQRKKRLKARGWPEWVVKLHQLPELTKVSAPDWFEIGWQVLQRANGGDVTSNPELAALGKSNVEYGRSRATTKRGQTGKQQSRAKGQIRRLLRDAFLSRWGNPEFKNKP